MKLQFLGHIARGGGTSRGEAKEAAQTGNRLHTAARAAAMILETALT